MSNAYMSRFSCIPHPAATPLAPKGIHVIRFFRSFSSCSSLIVAPASPLAARSSSSLVLAAQLTPASTIQRSEEWFALRRDKLTTSTFSTALGFWKGTRRAELWYEKVFTSDDQCMQPSTIHAMELGVMNEAAAIERYKNITGHDVSFLGFAIHPEQSLHWLGASPDGLLSCSTEAGILEVKCPHNKGKPELGLPWSTMPFYYMPQIQGQMEIMDREWVDLYCWTPNGSTTFRVRRERDYWELIHRILREFWWENVIAAREALLVGGEEAANFYKPAPKHRQTGEVIARSIKLALRPNCCARILQVMLNFIHDGLSVEKHIDDLWDSDFRSRREMDSGLSWADQWDTSNDPLPPAPKDDVKKEKDDKQSVKQKFSRKIKKIFGKKSQSEK